jgi:hypothetical protein
MSEVTEYTSTPQAPQAPMPSFWEDVIDIFVSPAGVFRRRANDSFWKPFLFVLVAISIVFIATYDTTMQPIMEAEMSRRLAASSQKLTPEQQAAAANITVKFAKVIFPVGIAFALTILGFGTWIVSKFFGAATTVGQAFLVASWSYFPRVLGTIAGSAQGLFMDPSKLTSAQAISLSPARFMDVDASNPLVYQLVARFDITILWETLLLGIGIYITGKISKNAAIGFAVVIWLLGSLQAVQAGFALMK